MTPAANHLYLELTARGFTFRLDGERFHVEPRDRLDEWDVHAIRAERDGLYSILTTGEAPAPPRLVWWRVAWEGGVCGLERSELQGGM